MNHTIYNTALVIHIVGITVMAGTTFIDFILFRQFWKKYPADPARSAVLEDILYKLQRFLGIGMLLIIISGVGMMAYLHEVWGAQMWFRVKMGFLILIIINGLAFRRRLGADLKKVLTGNASVAATPMLRRNVSIHHLLQMAFFITIYVLSVFKFN